MPKISTRSEHLCSLLAHHNINTQLLQSIEGPTFTRYEMSIDPFNFKIDQVLAIEENIAYVLQSPQPPIIYPIYEQSKFVIDIVNQERRDVDFTQLLAKVGDTSQYKIPMILGSDVYSNPHIVDLADLPHLLIAGTTGSGKSVNLRSMLTSMIYLGREKLLLTMIDPKSVELSVFGDLGLADVVTNLDEVSGVLNFVYKQVENRYKMLHDAGVSDISEMPGVPRIVVVIDELADLIQYKKTTTNELQRIVQKSRAAGVHVIAATQRPSVDVISGVIKNNFPARVTFKVSSQEDSRTILGGGGAEKLLGRGDMLYKYSSNSYQRLQGAYINSKQIKSLLGTLPSSFGKIST